MSVVGEEWPIVLHLVSVGRSGGGGGGGGALPCGCKPLIRSIRRHRAATTNLPVPYTTCQQQRLTGGNSH